jgi:ferric-dicitrate binding protein FerR (iron transport regulator)
MHRIHVGGGGALMDSLERRVTQLTNGLLDGLCTDDERAELGRLARQHPELAAEAVELAILHALLKWQSGNITEGSIPAEVPVVVCQETVVEPTHAPRAVSAGRVLWAVAAMLLVTCGVLTWRGDQTRGAADAVIADVTDQNGVRWADDSTALGDGNAILPGRLASLGGEYTLQFRSGPTIRVVGPASLDVKSDMLIEVDQGQVTAQVPKSSIGFTIDSPLVNVVDQGTQFGVSVGNGRADVIVFDGKVDVLSKVADGARQTRLTQGECVQIDRNGAIVRIADVRRDVEGRWWTDDRSDSGGHVIARVSDNIHSGEGVREFVCYQTTFEGLQEDAVAYSDNPHHQWNGLTADGLPDFLQGADYIKTFNDYRYLKYFEMKVDLARPANLYVFFDDRVDTPEWLKANFEDTGVDVGLDEGPWLDQVPEEYRHLDVNTTAAGGGNSIDNIFSVWRRRCDDGGTVSLGDCGEWGIDRIGFGGKGGRSMYGVAATPLSAASPRQGKPE